MYHYDTFDGMHLCRLLRYDKEMMIFVGLICFDLERDKACFEGYMFDSFKRLKRGLVMKYEIMCIFRRVIFDLRLL
jgi:hypothetical protein